MLRVGCAGVLVVVRVVVVSMFHVAIVGTNRARMANSPSILAYSCVLIRLCLESTQKLHWDLIRRFYRCKDDMLIV